MEALSDNYVYDPTTYMKKKKKKKKKDSDANGETLVRVTQQTENMAIAEMFKFNSQVQKKPVVTGGFNLENADPVQDSDGEEEDEVEGVAPLKYCWEGTDRDYDYYELLKRLFNILREDNPELAEDRRRTVMKPPEVLLEGTKKTVFVNFMDLCKIMHREPEHVMNYFLEEMQTGGSIDVQQRLVVKGRFATKDLELILRRFINEYVICNCCKGPDTTLVDDNQRFLIRCEMCGSEQAVAPIKAGFTGGGVGHRKNER